MIQLSQALHVKQAPKFLFIIHHCIENITQ